MKIRTQIYLSSFAAFALVVAMGTMLFVSTRNVGSSLARNAFANDMVVATTELRFVMVEYLFGHSERPRMQAQKRFDTLRRLLASDLYDGTPDQATMVRLRDRHRQLGLTFSRLVRNQEAGAAAMEDPGLTQALEGQLIGEFLEISQDIIATVARLAREADAQTASTQNRAGAVAAVFIVMVAAIVALQLLLVRRRMLIPIAQLEYGASLVARGNLSFRTGLAGNDEMAGLSRSLDHMVAQVQNSQGALYARNLIEASLDPLITIAADGKVTGVNEATVRVTGVSRTQLVGSDLAGYFTEPERVREACRQALSTGSISDQPLTVRARDGRLTDVLFNASVYRDDAGVPMGLFAAARDVTERKRVEDALRIAHERLRRLVDSNIVGIVIASASGDIVEANDYYLRLIGFSREELQRGEIDWRSITPAEWLVADEKAITELREKGVCTPYEKEYLRRDGTRVPVLLADAMLPGPGEQIAAFALDITERRRAESEIKALNASLERRVRERTAELLAANREMEAFAYSVSHDLRAPLRAIDGFSKVLEEDYSGKVDEEGRDSLHRVRAAAQRMGALIDDLLKLSRLSRAEMVREDVDLSRLAASVAQELQAAEPARKVVVDISPGLVVRGDRALLKVLLDNLIGNAWKFTSRHPAARIDVGSAIVEGDTAYFVRDDGAGFDMAYAGNLFGPFQRLHGEAEFPGTGIGLATVRRIVQRHGGRAWAEGVPEKGATFYFTLAAGNSEAPAHEREVALA